MMPFGIVRFWSRVISLSNYKLIIEWQWRQEVGKILNFTNNEQLKTPKTDCALKVYKDK